MHIVHTESSLGWGGQEIRILTEASGMLAKGHRVTLLTPPSARIFSESQRIGIETVALPLEKKRLTGLIAIRRWLSVSDVDIINTHSSTDSWLVGLALTLSHRSIPVVRTRHISAPVKPGAINRWLYGHAAKRVVTTGESLRQELIHRLKLPDDRVISVPTGIDLKRFSVSQTQPKTQARRAIGIPENAFVIGIAATLRSWKGHDNLVEAFCRLAEKSPDLHLVIAGDGPRRQHLESLIAQTPWASRVHLLGHREDVPEVLAALDLFVLPSYANEGVPQAIMQAMAMGLPVISTTIGAISDAVVDGTTGLLLPPNQPETLAIAIDSLITDPERLKNYGLAARQRAETHFSLDGMINAMESVFQAASSTRW
jgi:glycosyltransferase involved in cell wall biosynthesis